MRRGASWVPGFTPTMAHTSHAPAVQQHGEDPTSVLMYEGRVVSSCRVEQRTDRLRFLNLH